MRPYVELPGLVEFVLEESYVLGVTAEPGRLTFEVDFALTPHHPAYAAPLPHETDCFRRGTLRFSQVSRLTWQDGGAIQPAVDATGESDFGHFDVFEWDDSRYVLTGDWGRVEVTADEFEVTLRTTS